MPTLRKATLADIPALEALIARSARGLSTGDYSPPQIEGALRGAFGVDSQLLADETYFVVEDAGQIVGCGGWSLRSTLFVHPCPKTPSRENQSLLCRPRPRPPRSWLAAAQSLRRPGACLRIPGS